jgi:hypothetical protein
MSWLSIAITLLAVLTVGSASLAEDQPQCRWVPVKELTVEGQGWTDTEAPFDRLPARAKGVVPGAVWGLSKDAAGLAVRFTTDASRVSCRWKVSKPSLAMNHMPATGVSGVDLYVCLPAGHEVLPGQRWRWVGIGRPEAQVNEKQLVSGLPEGEHEFLLYLPLYNGVESVEIGVPPEAKLSPGPARPASQAKPVVFYGTSITQGGCASRPGMAYPAIVGRMVDRPTINLGFSGNGKMDASVVDLLAELEVAAYVIDCCPNMSGELVAERTEPLVRKLRAARPNTPLVLMENIEYQAAAVLPGTLRSYSSKNVALRAAYDKLLAAGVKGLHYVEGKPLFGDDGEATVDGTHATDLGFMRQAEKLVPALKTVLSGAG